MRGALVVLIVAGCTFEHRVVDHPPVDAATADATDAPASNADAMVPATCLDGTRCLRKAITIHHDQVTGHHTDFPMLVHFQDNELKLDARADGFDLVFTAGDGTTRLPYDRESYAGGDLVAWVRVPELRGDADHVLYLYYGSNEITDQADPVNTWASQFALVYHCDEPQSTITVPDATSNHSDGTTTTGTDLMAPNGQIGKAAQFDMTDAFATPASTKLTSTGTAGTISMWVNFKAATGTFQNLMSSANRFTAGDAGYELATHDNGDLYFYPNGVDDDYDLVTAPFSDNMWAYLAVTMDQPTGTLVIYVNGVAVTPAIAQIDTTTWTTPAMPTGWTWGDNDTARPFVGKLDEIRVQNVARSAGWIATEFANQSDPTKLATLGPEVILTP